MPDWIAKARKGHTMDNRERILACALDLFYQKGYDAAGIQEICQMAGVTKPTMYYYFGSKYGLLETLLNKELGGFMEALSQASHYCGSVEQSLYHFASVLLDCARANYRAYLLLMSLSYSARENEAYQAIKPYISRIHNLAVQLFEESSYVLGNMNGRQEQFAMGFLGLLNHYILFLGYQEVPAAGIEVTEEKKRSLIHQFMHGINS